MSDEINQLRDRIDALEARVAYQDDAIETLNQTITAQWQTIDALTRQVSQLSDRLKEAEAGALRPSNEPPPHY
jgi:SlyX protein